MTNAMNPIHCVYVVNDCVHDLGLCIQIYMSDIFTYIIHRVRRCTHQDIPNKFENVFVCADVCKDVYIHICVQSLKYICAHEDILQTNACNIRHCNK